MKYDPSHAYLLHTRRYRDTSLIIEAFTHQHGRLSLVAKGAASPKSAFRNVLQPGKKLLIAGRGKGELLNLSLAEEIAGSVNLQPSIFFVLAYVNELMLKLMAKFDPQSNIFDAYETVISALAKAKRADDFELEWSLRRFEYELLTQLGFMSDFSHTTDTQEVPNESDWYAYHPDEGLCSASCYNPLVAPPVSGHAITRLMLGELPDEHNSDARRSMKKLMRRLVDNAIPNGLKSRSVMREMLQSQTKEKSIS